MGNYVLKSVCYILHILGLVEIGFPQEKGIRGAAGNKIGLSKLRLYFRNTIYFYLVGRLTSNI